MVLAVVAERIWHIETVNVVGAYIDTSIDRDVYIRHPGGYEKKDLLTGKP